MSLEPDYNEIRYRIKKKYDNRVEFISHLVAFLGASFVLWGFIRPDGTFGSLLTLATGGWFIGLLCHAVVFWGKEAQEQAIQREIEREREFRGQYNSDADMKRKREHLELSDDGEILEVVDEDQKSLRRR